MAKNEFYENEGNPNYGLEAIKQKNKDYFRSFTLDPFTVDWNNEIGFAPEYLYEIGTYPESGETTPLIAAEEQAEYGKKID